MDRCRAVANRSHMMFLSLSSAAILLGGALPGCGAPPAQVWSVDDTGNQLAGAGADVSSALEYALAGASLITEADLSGAGGASAAASSVSWLLGACVTAKPQARGAPPSASGAGLDVTFTGSTCGVPATSLLFQGKVSGVVTDATSGALSVTLAAFKVAGLTLDGTILLTPTSARTFRYSVQGLKLNDGGNLVTLDATGMASVSTDHVGFDGTGMVSLAGRSYVFDAKNIARSFADACFPDHGSLVITAVDAATAGSATPSSASLIYDNNPGGLGSDQSGNIALNYQGHSQSWSLPSRVCAKL